MALFQPDYPSGFSYQPDFISVQQEAELSEAIRALTFADFEMRGVVAKRRVAFFGETYDREAAGPIPSFLLPLRAAVAASAGIEPDAFAMALINEYRPGSPIGWHRDAPRYDIVAGVSLLTACRMKLRPYVSPTTRPADAAPRRATHDIWLEPRSAYVISGLARTDYEHHIPPVTALRYSITFRTLRPRARR